jgi:hypothetical protein
MDGIQLQAEVEAVEPDLVHRVQIVYVRMGHSIISGLCPIETKLQIGGAVHILIDPARLYFFDSVSGKRI